MLLETKEVLGNVLRENERVKQRQLVAFGVLFVALVGILSWVGRLAGRPATDLRELIVGAVIATVVAVTYGVMGAGDLHESDDGAAVAYHGGIARKGLIAVSKGAERRNTG